MKCIRNIKFFFIVALITYLMIELVCFVFLKTKFKAAHFPGFRYQYNYTHYDFPIAEINPIWGTWHYKEDYTETKQCFESVYHINSVGARDIERVKDADTNRVIFLGDSFIEGYGLQEKGRLSNQLELALHKEVLNFGCGYFTPTQEYLVYKNLASTYSHNTVVIGILPFNDLVEDDSSFHENDSFIHYKPFFEGDYPGYNLIYKEDNLSKSTFNKEGYYALQNKPRQRLLRFLKECTCWYNIYQFIRTNKTVVNDDKRPYSGYYDYTAAQANKLKYILGQLKQSASGKKLVLVTIPVHNDFIRYKNNSAPSLLNELKPFCETEGIVYIDLLTAFSKSKEDPAGLYFSCDGHWNESANKKAAEILLPLLQR